MSDLPDLDQLLGEDADTEAHIDARDRDEFDAQNDKLLAALGHARSDVARGERRCAAQQAELSARQARAMEPLHARVEQLEAVLELRHRALLAERPKATRVDGLTNGSLTSKAGSVVYVVDDEAALLTWCKTDLPEVVGTPDPAPPPEPKVSKAYLAAAVKDYTLRKGRDGSLEPISDEGHVFAPTGEQIPGVHVVKKDRTFTAMTEGFTDDPPEREL